jgi:hypothetical protein
MNSYIAITRVKLKRSKDHRRMRSKLHLEHIQEEYKYAIGKGFETLEVRNRDPEAATKNIPEKKKSS